jgi:HlyD family secretion protein
MSAKNRMKLIFKIVLWLGVLAAVIAPLVWLYNREPVIEVTALTVERGPVEQTVAAIASGTIMPERKSMMAGSMMGTIAAIHAGDGDRVEKDDLLVEFEHVELDAQVELARANLRVGLSRLKQAKIAAEIYRDISATRLNQTTAQLEAAKADFDRIRALSERKMISQSEFDKMDLALRVANEARNAAEVSVRENLVRQEEIRSAEAAIEQLEAGVTAAEAMREKAFVRAPFAGVIAKRLLDVGEAVTMGLPLLHLVAGKKVYIEAPFDEANASEIKLGQTARIEVDAWPDEEFPGKISWISPVVAINQDLTRTLNIKVELENMDARLLPGMSADVTIIVDRKEGVIKAPSESLVRDEFAYAIVDGRVYQRAVELGIGNWEYREVKSGLGEGDYIVTSVAVKGLNEGAPVKVVEALEGY